MIAAVAGEAGVEVSSVTMNSAPMVKANPNVSNNLENGEDATSSNKDEEILVIIIAASSGGGVLLITVILLLLCRCKKKTKVNVSTKKTTSVFPQETELTQKEMQEAAKVVPTAYGELQQLDQKTKNNVANWEVGSGPQQIRKTTSFKEVDI